TVSLPPAMPTMTPNGGHFAGSQTVALASTTPHASLYYTLDGSEPTSQSSLYDAANPPLLNMSTTVKAKAFRSDLGWSATATVGFTSDAEFTPRSLADLTLWLRADAGVSTGGASVVSWEDQSGKGNDATLVNGQPSYRVPTLTADAQSAMPMMHFSNQHLTLKQRLLDIRTVFWVLRNSAADFDYHAPMGEGGNNIFVSESDRKIWLSGEASDVVNGQTYLNGSAINGSQTFYPAS